MISLLTSNLLCEKQKNRISKSSYQSMYLLEKTLTNSGVELKISGSTLNVYTVIIDDLNITCDCPDIYECNKHKLYCKHICFVISMIGKLYNVEIFLNKKLKIEEKVFIILRLFNISNDPDIINDMLIKKYNNLKLKLLLQTNNIEPRNKCEDCVVCFNTMKDNFYTCNICSNAIHNDCLEIWLQKNKTCVFCRNTIEKNLKVKDTYLNISK